MRRKKLLLVTDHRFFGSAAGVFDGSCYDQRFFDDYTAVFDELRLAARIRSDPRPAASARIDSSHVSVCALPDVQGLPWVLGPVRLRRALREAVDWADAVCLRVPSVSGQMAFRLARERRKPVMFELIGDPAAALHRHEHGWIKSAYGRYMALHVRAMARHAQVGIYVSHSLRRAYPAGPRTVADDISDLRLPATLLRPPKRYRERTAPLVTVLVASLVPVKRHDVLLRAVRLAMQHGVAIQVHLVGDGPLRPSLETLASDLGLTEAVTFHGQVADRKRLFEILDASDLFVMTSASEGMPRAMLEAMARGLAAIGTDVGGIVELLPPEQRIPVNDCEALGTRLVELATCQGSLARFAQHSGRVAPAFTAERLSSRRQAMLSVLRSHTVRPLPKVLVAVTDPQSGVLLRGQLSYLRQQGFDVALLCGPGDAAVRLAAAEQATLLPVDMARSIDLVRDGVALVRIAAQLRLERPCLVSAGTPKAGFLVMLAAWLCRTPVRVYVLRGLRSDTADGFTRRLLWLSEWIACRLAHHVLCNSHSLRARAQELGLLRGVPATVLGCGSGNGVDTERFSITSVIRDDARRLRRRYGIADRDLVVGFVGRLVPDKGLCELVEAWQRLRDRIPGTRMLVVGHAESHAPLPPAVDIALHEDPHIHLVGYQEDLVPFYAAMDVLALPSYREGFPNVVLEAGSMGIPTVTTHVPGCVDAVEDGVTGTVVPARDANALERALATYLEDATLRHRHGQAARARILRHFTRVRVWDELARLYKQLLRDKGVTVPSAVPTRAERLALSNVQGSPR